MVTRRTNKGVPIDMDKLIAASNPGSPAVGNMRVNAAGDVIKDGQIIKKNEDRVREYYDKNPKSSTSKASLKGEMPKLAPDTDVSKAPTPKTAKTAKENVRTSSVTQADVAKREQEIREEMVAPIEEDIAPIPPVQEPDEFDAPEGSTPLGYKEVELPNGDIEMVPVYKKEDL